MTDDPVKGPHPTTLEKVRRWSNACKRLDELKSQMNSAECEVENARNDLGKWIVPEDSKVGERFNVWLADGILCGAIQLTKDGHVSGDYIVTWRKQPSAMCATQMRL